VVLAGVPSERVPPFEDRITAAVFELTLYVTVAVWARPALVPFTVTVYVPAPPKQDRVEVPDVVVLLSVMLARDSVQVRPVEGEIVSDNVTVPVNPLRPLTVIVEVPAWPFLTFRVVGLAVTVKSWTVKVTVAVRVRPLLAPVTVTM
jgi:hypothetical protein